MVNSNIKLILDMIGTLREEKKDESLYESIKQKSIEIFKSYPGSDKESAYQALKHSIKVGLLVSYGNDDSREMLRSMLHVLGEDSEEVLEVVTEIFLKGMMTNAKDVSVKAIDDAWNQISGG
ncbi:MAG: hypothetical protein J6I84_03445 [Bacilli bacterium]|nr:hypothetical protein [Bacilli bacterium]